MLIASITSQHEYLLARHRFQHIASFMHDSQDCWVGSQNSSLTHPNATNLLELYNRTQQPYLHTNFLILAKVDIRQ